MQCRVCRVNVRVEHFTATRKITIINVAFVCNAYVISPVATVANNNNNNSNKLLVLARRCARKKQRRTKPCVFDANRPDEVPSRQTTERFIVRNIEKTDFTSGSSRKTKRIVYLYFETDERFGFRRRAKLKRLAERPTIKTNIGIS